MCSGFGLVLDLGFSHAPLSLSMPFVSRSPLFFTWSILPPLTFSRCSRFGFASLPTIFYPWMLLADEKDNNGNTPKTKSTSSQNGRRAANVNTKRVFVGNLPRTVNKKKN